MAKILANIEQKNFTLYPTQVTVANYMALATTWRWRGSTSGVTSNLHPETGIPNALPKNTIMDCKICRWPAGGKYPYAGRMVFYNGSDYRVKLKWKNGNGANVKDLADVSAGDTAVFDLLPYAENGYITVNMYGADVAQSVSPPVLIFCNADQYVTSDSVRGHKFHGRFESMAVQWDGLRPMKNWHAAEKFHPRYAAFSPGDEIFPSTHHYSYQGSWPDRWFGIAWDLYFEWCWSQNKICWVNLPIGASKAYVEALATLANKYPGLKIGWAAFNEIWNGRFDGHDWLYKVGLKRFPQTLTGSGDQPTEIARQMRFCYALVYFPLIEQHASSCVNFFLNEDSFWEGAWRMLENPDILKRAHMNGEYPEFDLDQLHGLHDFGAMNIYGGRDVQDLPNYDPTSPGALKASLIHSFQNRFHAAEGAIDRMSNLGMLPASYEFGQHMLARNSAEDQFFRGFQNSSDMGDVYANTLMPWVHKNLDWAAFYSLVGDTGGMNGYWAHANPLDSMEVYNVKGQAILDSLPGATQPPVPLPPQPQPQPPQPQPQPQPSVDWSSLDNIIIYAETTVNELKQWKADNE